MLFVKASQNFWSWIASLTSLIAIALDLRALQHEFLQGLDKITSEELTAALGSYLPKSPLVSLTADVYRAMKESFESTSTMDVTARMEKVAASSTTVLVDSIITPGFVAPAHVGSMLTSIPAFRSRVSSRTAALLDQLRQAYLSGARGAAPARPFLNKTRSVRLCGNNAGYQNARIGELSPVCQWIGGGRRYNWTKCSSHPRGVLLSSSIISTRL